MRIILFIFCSSFFFNFKAQSYKSGEALIKAMHKKYYQGPCKCYTFSQRNTHYKADTISGRSEWHEEINFPDFFRINFGDVSKGNFVIFRNDSSLNYKANKLVKVGLDTNSLLLILGGMYYRSLDDVIFRLRKSSYNTSIISEQNWGPRKAFVIGAKAEDLTKNQIWVDKESFRVLRIVEKLGNGSTMDMMFDGHQKSCNGFVESKVTFLRDGKLEQVEEYYNIKEKSCVR